MRPIPILSLVCVVFLSGCATTGKYKKDLDGWVGSRESEMISAWGPPHSVYKVNDKEKIFTYHRSRNVMLPGTNPTYQTTLIGNTAYTNATGGSPARNINAACTTNFTLVSGFVKSWRFEGNDCTAI